MRNMSKGLCLTMLLIGLSPILSWGADDEMIPNPVYKHWANFKIGASVTRREKVKFSADSPEGQIYHERTLVKDIVYKLIETTPEKAVVEVIDVEHGRGYVQESAPFKITYFAKIKKGLGTPKDAFDQHKQEDVDVEWNGKNYKATMVATSHKVGGITRSQKIWLSDEIPGGIIKDIKTQKKGDDLISESTLEVIKLHIP